MVLGSSSEGALFESTVPPLLNIAALSQGVGRRASLHNVTFSVGMGEIIGLFGERGSGKASVINLVSGDIFPSSGRILFGGEDITHLSPEMRAQRGIARAPDLHCLFGELSAKENVLLHGVQHHLPLFSRQGGRTYVEEARDLLVRVGLGAEAMRPVAELSIVQQCMVSIAIALASKPSLILVGDSGIADVSAWSDFGAAMGGLASQGISVLFTAAQLCTVMEICDRIVVLHDGAIIATGAPAGIAAEAAVWRNYRDHLQ